MPRLPSKGRPPGKQFVKNYAKGIDIGPGVCIGPVAIRKLRRHVGRRPEQFAVHGQVMIRVPDLGQTKINDVRKTIRIDNDIGRLQVAMHHTFVVSWL